jgi:hypothetical protein
MHVLVMVHVMVQLVCCSLTHTPGLNLLLLCSHDCQNLPSIPQQQGQPA